MAARRARPHVVPLASSLNTQNTQEGKTQKKLKKKKIRKKKNKLS
jgi:hypothetical protein